MARVPVEGPVTPWSLVREAIKAVPAVKYALGVGGVAAIVAIIVGFRIDYRVAVFGTIVVFVLMFVLLVFARLATMPGMSLYWPSIFATWTSILLLGTSAALLLTSYFFDWPRREIFPGEGIAPMKANGRGPIFEKPQLNARLIDGCIRSSQFPVSRNLQCISSAQQVIANAFCREAGYAAADVFSTQDTGQFQLSWKLTNEVSPGNRIVQYWSEDNTGSFVFTSIRCR